MTVYEYYFRIKWIIKPFGSFLNFIPHDISFILAEPSEMFEEVWEYIDNSLKTTILSKKKTVVM